MIIFLQAALMKKVELYREQAQGSTDFQTRNLTLQTEIADLESEVARKQEELDGTWILSVTRLPRTVPVQYSLNV